MVYAQLCFFYYITFIYYIILSILVLIVFIFIWIFYFRELLLNNNYLRVLPYEIGKLFHLHILGLHGNPLNKEVLSIYNEPNGTLKLLTYMLDNLQGKILLYFTFIWFLCIKFLTMQNCKIYIHLPLWSFN